MAPSLSDPNTPAFIVIDSGGIGRAIRHSKAACQAWIKWFGKKSESYHIEEC